MEVKVWKQPLLTIPSNLLVLFYLPDERPLKGDLGKVDWKLNGTISKLIKKNKLDGTFKEKLMFPITSNKMKSDNVLIVCLGKKESVTDDLFSEVMDVVVDVINQLQMNKVSVSVEGVARCGISVPRVAEIILDKMLDNHNARSENQSDWKMREIGFVATDEIVDEILLGIHKVRVNLKKKLNVASVEILKDLLVTAS